MLNNYSLPSIPYSLFSTSTFVEEPLQIGSFLQNKPNLPDAQMNVNTVITKDYENEHLR